MVDHVARVHWLVAAPHRLRRIGEAVEPAEEVVVEDECVVVSLYDPFDAPEEAVGETNEPEADDVGEDGGKPYDDVYYSASGAALPSVR